MMNKLTSIAGNWSISRSQLASDLHPDFCSGFLYLTSPRVGAELVQAGLSLYGDMEVEQIEDSLITGENSSQLSHQPNLRGVGCHGRQTVKT